MPTSHGCSGLNEIILSSTEHDIWQCSPTDTCNTRMYKWFSTFKGQLLRNTHLHALYLEIPKLPLYAKFRFSAFEDTWIILVNELCTTNRHQFTLIGSPHPLCAAVFRQLLKHVIDSWPYSVIEISGDLKGTVDQKHNSPRLGLLRSRQKTKLLKVVIFITSI